MNLQQKTFLPVLLMIMICIIACDEESGQPPVVPRPFQRFWENGFFTESSVEIPSIPEQAEVTISAPDVTDLKWTFLENDSVLLEGRDTTWTNWYYYDTATLQLQFANGSYDILKFDEDSLDSIRSFQVLLTSILIFNW